MRKPGILRGDNAPDVERTPESAPLRFWAILLCLFVPLGIIQASIHLWPTAEEWSGAGRARLLFDIILPTLSLAAFIALFSRSTLRQHGRSCAIGLAFLWAGTIDLSYALLINGGAESNAVFWNWTVLHLAFGMMLLYAIPRHEKKSQHKTRDLALLIFSVSMLGICSGQMSRFVSTISSGFGGEQWPHAILWVPALVFLLASIAAWRRFKATGDPLLFSLALTAILMGFAELIMSFSKGPHDHLAFSANATKLGAYLSPIIAAVTVDAARMRRSLAARVRVSFAGMVGTILVGCVALVVYMAHRGHTLTDLQELMALRKTASNLKALENRPAGFLGSYAIGTRDPRRSLLLKHALRDWRESCSRNLENLAARDNSVRSASLIGTWTRFDDDVSHLAKILPTLPEETARDRLRRLVEETVPKIDYEIGLLGARIQDRFESEHRQVESDLTQSVVILIALVLLVTAGAMFVSTVASRNTIYRIASVAQATREFADGDTAARAMVTGCDELANLGLTFNNMAERITLQTRELRILARVMDGTSDPVVVVNADQTIAFVNRAFSQQTGWKRTDIVGRGYEDLFTGPMYQECLNELWEALDRGEQWNGEMMTRGDDGRTLDASVWVAPVEFDGTTRYYVALHRDIGKLRTLERERSEMNHALLKIHTIGQQLIETLNVEDICWRAVEGINREFHVHGRIWMAQSRNPDDLQIVASSWRRDDASGDRAPEQDIVSQAVEDLDKVVAQGSLPEGQSSRQSESPSTSGAFPLVVKGELLGVLEIWSENETRESVFNTLHLLSQVLAEAISNARLHTRTTEQAEVLERLSAELAESADSQKAINEQLEDMNVRLREADELKNQFLATTSHELRTPLTSVTGLLQLILDGLAESRDEEMEFVGEAQKCARHLLGIINDLLDVARIEAGKLQVTPGRVDIMPLFSDVQTVTKVQAAEKNLELRFDADEGLCVFADYDRSKQALINLVGNAIKFTHKGVVSVSARKHPDKGYVEIAVSDTGIGIASENLESIFDTFIQADSGDNRRFGGSGLGLAITRNLVEMMGGVVRASSKGEGMGTRMTLTLPIYRVASYNPPKIPSMPQPNATSDPRIILLVEGDPEHRKTVRQILEGRGHDIHEATRAEEAFRVAREIQPDVVLTEGVLSYDAPSNLKNGMDLAQAISSEPELMNVTVAIVSGQGADHPSLEEAHRNRLPVLYRPIETEELINVVEDDDDATDANLNLLLVTRDTGILDVLETSMPGPGKTVEMTGSPDEAITILNRADISFDAILLHDDLDDGDLDHVLESMDREQLAQVILLTGLNSTKDSFLDDHNIAGVITVARLRTQPHVLRRHLRTIFKTLQTA